MKILIDIDNTLCDNMKTWLDIYNRLYNDNVQPRDIQSWDILSYIKKEAMNDFFEVCLPNSYYESKDFGYAKDVIRGLSEKHEIMYVTSGLYPEKIEWMLRFGYLKGSTVNPENIIVAKPKWWIAGDIMIDDYPVNMEGRKWKLLFNQPWNQDDISCIRMFTWEDIEYAIRRIEEEEDEWERISKSKTLKMEA